MPFSEEEKISLAKQAYNRFETKINELIKKQDDLFESIMKRIDERKIEDLRRIIKEINDHQKKF